MQKTNYLRLNSHGRETSTTRVGLILQRFCVTYGWRSNAQSPPDKVSGGHEKRNKTACTHLVSGSNDLRLDPEVPRRAVRRKEGNRVDVGLVQAISFDDLAVIGRGGPARGAGQGRPDRQHVLPDPRDVYRAGRAACLGRLTLIARGKNEEMLRVLAQQARGNGSM